MSSSLRPNASVRRDATFDAARVGSITATHLAAESLAVTGSTTSAISLSSDLSGAAVILSAPAVDASGISVGVVKVDGLLSLDSPRVVGTVTLTGTTAVNVAIPSMRTGDLVFLSVKAQAGTLTGAITTTVTNAVGFSVVSSAADTSVYNYMVIRPF
jgi:hypothetical protein